MPKFEVLKLSFKIPAKTATKRLYFVLKNTLVKITNSKRKFGLNQRPKI